MTEPSAQVSIRELLREAADALETDHEACGDGCPVRSLLVRDLRAAAEASAGSDAPPRCRLCGRPSAHQPCFDCRQADAPPRWQDISTAPKDGFAILAHGRHDPHSIRRKDVHAGLAVGDWWIAIVQWDIWRQPNHWVFAKDGTPTWTEPTHWMPLPDPPLPSAPSALSAQISTKDTKDDPSRSRSDTEGL